MERYEGLNGVAVRNALTTETDADILRHFAADPRVLVNTKALARLRKLAISETPETPTIEARVSGRGAPKQTSRRKNSAPPFVPEPTPEALPVVKSAETRTVELHKTYRDLGWTLVVDATEDAAYGPDLVDVYAPSGIEDEPTHIDDATPPVEAVGERGAVWSIPAVEATKTCTVKGCGATGLVSEMFGYRHVVRGKKTLQIPQPQCKACRNEAARRAKAKNRKRR